MKKFPLIAILWICAICFAGCGGDGTDGPDTPKPPTPKDPTIELESTSADFTEAGGTLRIGIKASEAWSASVINARADEWCTVAPTSGKAGSAELQITTTANETADDRSATVQVKSGATVKTIAVSQKQKDALTVTASKFEVAAEGGEVVVEVKANVDFTYAIDEAASDWIEYVGTRALKSSALTFRVKANDDPRKREGTITVHSGSLAEEVVIYQQASAPAIILTQNEYTVAAAGGDITVEVAHNVDVEMLLPDDAEWIAEDRTRAMSTDTYRLKVAANETNDPRTAEIQFVNRENGLSEKVLVTQLQLDAIVVAQPEYLFGLEGGRLEFDVQTNVELTVTLSDGAASWIHRVETRGMETRRLRFDIDPCDAEVDREATITIAGGTARQTITVRQRQDAIVVAQPEYTVGVEGGPLEFDVRTNVELTVTLSADAASWIHRVETRGMETQRLRFTVDPCAEDVDRTGTITIAGGTATQTITVRQKKDAIVVADAEYRFGVEGGPLNFEVLTNVELTVQISDEATSWIHPTQTRALEARTLGFTVDPCGEETDRTGWITISGGSARQTITVIQSGMADVLERERAALVAFYQATGGDGWTNRDCWCSDDPVDAWEGVSVDSRGRVTRINLENNNLTGAIPEAIGELTAMQELWLGGNRIAGELPASMGNMTQLWYLSLMGNRLSGSIPASFANLTQLQALELQRNQLTGSFAHLPESVGLEENWINIVYGNRFTRDDLIDAGIDAAHFSATDLEGGTIDAAAEYASHKYTVLIQWAVWSAATVNNMEELVELYDTYRDHGLEFIGWADGYDMERFISEYYITWRNFVVTGETPFFFCRDGHPYRNNGTYYPHSYDTTTLTVVDADGKIVFSDLVEPISNLRAFLRERLGEGTPPVEYESTDYSRDGEVTVLQRATEGNGIDVVLMGDAFSDRQIADGTYGTIMNKAMEAFFMEEPYRSFRHLFNIYQVTVVSKNERYKSGTDTALSCYFGEGTEVGGNDRKCFEYAERAVASDRMVNTLIIVMMNSGKYAGTCYMYYHDCVGDYGAGRAIAYFPLDQDDQRFAEILHHEAGGHGFAKLGDEYAYESKGTIPSYEIESYRSDEPYGWWKNVDFTTDRTQVKWHQFLEDTRYAYEGLGIFEGACTYWRGAYRPTEYSIMLGNTGGFNAPSREAIYRRIHKLAYGESWNYDYEEFVAYDAINRATETRVPYRAAARPRPDFRPTHPPVVIGK